jgi:hypothetical protein
MSGRQHYQRSRSRPPPNPNSIQDHNALIEAIMHAKETLMSD